MDSIMASDGSLSVKSKTKSGSQSKKKANVVESLQ